MPYRKFGDVISIGLVGVYVVVAILGIDAWRRGPFVGFEVAEAGDGRFIANVETSGRAWEAGVRDGDVLVSVDGIPASSGVFQGIREPGSEVIFRSDSTGDFVSATPDDGLPSKPNPLGLEVAGLAFAVLGVLAFARSSRSTHATVFSWLALTIAIGFVASAGSLVWHIPMTVVVDVTMHWIPPLLIATVLLFSEPGSGFRRLHQRLWLWPAIGVAVFLQTLHLVTVLTWSSAYDAVTAARFAYLAFGFVIAPVLMVLALRGARGALVREQLRIVLAGTVIGLAPFLVLTLLPGVVGQNSIIRPDFAALAALVIPAAFVYAILRHELMGIRRLVHRSVAFAFMSVVALSAYVGGVIVLRAFTDETDDSTFAITGVVMLAVVGGLPLVTRVRDESFDVVDRLLYREFRGQTGLLRQVSLKAVQATEFDDLIAFTTSAVADAMELDFAGYLEVRGDRRFHADLRVGTPPDVVIGRVRAFEFDGASAIERADLPVEGRVRSVILCGFRLGDEVDARSVLYFGPKYSDEPFSDADRHMIEVLCDVIVTAGSRLRLLEQLQLLNDELTDVNTRLVDTEERERAEVSSYLHDGPLQMVTYVLSQYRERGLSPDLAGILDQATAELRATSLRLSPAFITDLGLVPTLEWLVDESMKRAGHSVRLELENIDRDERFDGSAELTIYRMIQEALVNCEKHAKARAVSVKLVRHNGSLTASVEDDGVGMDSYPVASPGAAKLHGVDQSLGIRTMKYRIEAHGGRLVIGGAPTGGTKIVASIPA